MPAERDLLLGLEEGLSSAPPRPAPTPTPTPAPLVGRLILRLQYGENVCYNPIRVDYKSSYLLVYA